MEWRWQRSQHEVVLFSRDRDPVLDDGEALEADGGAVCTAMWMCLMPLTCTLKCGWNNTFCLVMLNTVFYSLLDY